MVMTAATPRYAGGAERPPGLGLSLIGQAAKRGIIGRQPSPERLLGEIEGWLAAGAADLIRTRRWAGDGSGSGTLLVNVHPAAEEMEVSAGDAGGVMIRAVTSGAGPGYHTYVCHLVKRLGAELGIVWAAPDAEAGTGDATRYFETGDRSFAERALLGWLHASLTGALTDRSRSVEPIDLSLASGTRFTAQGALLSVLGPRDDAWLESAVQRPPTAIDIWPWWHDATDARYLLNRALCLMWTQVRWRPPAVDGERELADEVLDLLRRAHSFEPGLDYPWREWAELGLLADAREVLLEGVKHRAKSESGPLIGYRRLPVEIEHQGWSLVVPGSFAERRSEEEVWLGETGRSITVAAVATGTEAGPMPPEVFLDQVAGQLGEAVLSHRRDDIVGRAVLRTDTSSGIEVGVVDGYSAVLGSGAAIRVVFEDPTDWEWALETWRALEHR